MTLLYLLLALLFTCFYYSLFKDIFNPNMIFLAVWFVTCSISCIDYADYLKPWCIEMHFVTIISGLSFFIGSILGVPARRISKRELISKVEISYTYRYIVYCLFFLCMTCCLIEWVNGGGQIAVALDSSNGDLKSQLDGDIAGIHYGTIFLPYLAIFSYFSIVNADKRSWIDIFIVVSIILTSFFFRMSRGDMLIYILSFFFIYTRYNRIGLSKILLLVLLLALVVIGFMLLRVSETSIVMTTTDNPYFSIIYTYVATCFANLNDLILLELPYHFIGDATFSPLWTLTGMYSYREITLVDQMGTFNAVTYLYNFYHDYKIFGAIFFPFLIGTSISILYKKVINGNCYWILLLAAMQKAIFTPFFGNYFFGDFVALFPFLFISFIILFLFTYKIRPIHNNFRI